MYDASTFVGTWPFDAGATTTVGQLTRLLGQQGVRAAAISPLGSILAAEPQAANRSLLRALRRRQDDQITLLGVPILDPTQPLWPEHLAECLIYGGSLVRAIKIVPNYHVYQLGESVVADLIATLRRQALPLVIQLRMVDERAHHPLMKVPGVPVNDVAALAATYPDLPILACGAYQSELASLGSAHNLSVELSFVESGYLLRDALAHLGPKRLLLGTHTPLHYSAVGVAKLASDTIAPTIRQQITETNFVRFFGAIS